ncbi:MAG: Ig-like domain-containing protein [Candidatus Faecousia sp.]|nr:Ig-like domain-containing protein [Candidatus Faecousia sp.]
MKGKKLCTLIFALVLLLTCLAVPAYADDSEDNQENIETAAENENPTIDWTCYDYDELILIREGLDDYIHELERQYAIENGNRVITLNETEVTIYQGKNYSFEAEVKRVVEDAPEKTEFVWTSSDEAIAKVSAKGLVTAVGYGDAVITCTASDDEFIFAEAVVHVVLPVTGVTMDTPNATLLLSEKDPSLADVTLNCTIMPENAYVQEVKWSSSNEKVATVDETGNVHAVTPGTVKITATSQDTFAAPKSASCTVTVLQAVSTVELNETEITLNVRANQNLTASVYPENASKKDLIWESSNPEVVTVSKTGGVSAVSTGTATITCTAADGSGAAATCKVTVIQMVNNLKIESASATITANKNGSVTLSAVVSPKEATNQTLVWESSDTDVATVDSNGVVTAVNGGSATITCMATDGSKKTAKINIYVPSIAVDSVQYSVTSKDGLKISFKYYGKAENLVLSPEKCTYFSASMVRSGEQVVLRITPIKAGTGTLTLSDKADSRSTVKLSVKVQHSACYDSTSYPVGDYTNVLRSPSTYKGSAMSVYGRVLQKSQGLFSTVLRVATRGRWDNVFYITCSNKEASGIIEDDYITVYGECGGTETYTTVLGSSITIPAIEAEKIFLGRH